MRNEDESSLESLNESIKMITKILFSKNPDFLCDFDQCELISNDILLIFEFVVPNLILPLLTNLTCKQDRANEIFAQQKIHDFLLNIIQSKYPDPNYSYRIHAIRSLFNIIHDSEDMQIIFIQSNSVNEISYIFANTTDPNEEILPELMMLMSFIIENRNKFSDFIDDDFFNEFILNCIFRITCKNVSNAEKYDYYAFSDFIYRSKENLDFLVQNIQFKDIFNNIEYYNNENIINILSVLLDIFIEIEENNYDLSTFKDIIELNIRNLYLRFRNISQLSFVTNENETDYRLLCLLFNFTYHYFHFCEDPIDSFFDKYVYNLFLKYLTNGSYKIRFDAFKAIESIVLTTDTNRQTFISFITNKFFLSLIDLLDSDSPELDESILNVIFNLLQIEDKRKAIKVIRIMGEDSFDTIEKLLASEELSDTASELCDTILNINNEIKEEVYYSLYFDYDEIAFEDEEINYNSDNYNQIDEEIQFNFLS